ncbi:1-phosphofructokinase [Clostridium argentinense CDC 2741]|uniref:Tagatose-6-phosphate kinase n=1 Tax=Clostridium argentinense CDC 2741 TaxID=1418104 RepID=A0A0C1R9S9_9CLOT|nr:1-phosphofructokinase [Clostridium argentinense]ARC85494.1 1-phosphofructokinase [Clostridium argentinense]KIE47206.1 1-phosphofructokinase [Clostridium argentinense CDC 2741]NFF40006.1 1-phosphofructokinase [Clostridium argentinense]NFP50294.1 1-phosphofructokinase [Clostridium argentinense]NFP71935.1 1-phosphofructokinase [Clostridium argentinense]
MITITLNPSIDRRYNIKNFERGKVFRADDFQYTPGGKGLNVAKVIKTLNEPVIATGFLGGRSGSYIVEKLDEMNIRHNFVSIDGETRSCLAIISDDGSQTEILESGPLISQKDMQRFYKLYEELIRQDEIICISGSMPKDVDIETYKNLIETANREGKKILLDTSGEALKKGMEAIPYLIKPNKEELENLIGNVIFTEEDIIKAVSPIIKEGINIVAVSLGREGCLVFNDNYMYRVRTPKVKAVNPVGSGDAMIAGFAVSLKRNYEFENMLKLAAACGTANALEEETGKADINNINRLIEDIIIEKIKL